jgi:hypothetical protein
MVWKHGFKSHLKLNENTELSSLVVSSSGLGHQSYNLEAKR